MLIGRWDLLTRLLGGVLGCLVVSGFLLRVEGMGLSGWWTGGEGLLLVVVVSCTLWLATVALVSFAGYVLRLGPCLWWGSRVGGWRLGVLRAGLAGVDLAIFGALVLWGVAGAMGRPEAALDPLVQGVAWGVGALVAGGSAVLCWRRGRAESLGGEPAAPFPGGWRSLRRSLGAGVAAAGVMVALALLGPGPGGLVQDAPAAVLVGVFGVVWGTAAGGLLGLGGSRAGLAPA